MCYSAQIWADYRKYVRVFGAVMDIREFVDTFWHRREEMTLKLPKALEAAFESEPAYSEELRKIQQAIAEYKAERTSNLEQQLFKQVKRRADAERVLASGKVTKKAQEDLRISTSKIDQLKGWLNDLRRTELTDEDSRIFPGHYAPVMVWEDGQRVVKPMRYQCRPPGKPAFYDTKYPGTYNARRDNLEGEFWKPLFGCSHGVMLASAFYENVSRPEGNVVLEFRPRPQHDMLVACLWSRWVSPDGKEELLSFAAITDEPPEEVAAAGHDRCIIPIKPEHLDAWLQPDAANLKEQYAILDDRERPYYEHRLAA
ncbi:SOS response-associated peptidase family protein [Methylibium rhizosphaerae]|uniref:SOS response-associated peptidase family protein n=1 Tax=Methylibium rhizosphaerae TaxID=2570323 RepID=UPI00112BB9C1|nr:SOS response-associated peptidase family protein [Methylibium rhizosphaerae]